MDELDISFGKHWEDTIWKVHYLSWTEFVDLRKARRTRETMADYDKMDKAAQRSAKMAQPLSVVLSVVVEG